MFLILESFSWKVRIEEYNLKGFLTLNRLISMTSEKSRSIKSRSSLHPKGTYHDNLKTKGNEFLKLKYNYVQFTIHIVTVLRYNVEMYIESKLMDK